MMFKETFRCKINPNTFLIATMIIVAFLLCVRSSGLYPLVFADEYTYSKFSRLLPFSEANIPGYLYFLIYKTTNLCGDGFLNCARLFNAVFFVLAAPFIYLIGKKLTGEKTAVLIAVLSILGPMNSYTAYFMPESLYFLSFWALSYWLLTTDKTHSVWHWIFLGSVFGISALIKPHALFLIPVFVVYFLIVQRQVVEKPSNRSKVPLINQYIAFFGAAFFIKFMLGFLLAGKTGITLFGAGYSSIASGSVADPHRYIALLKMAFDNVQGHFLALILMFSVPMAYVFLTSASFFKRNFSNPQHRIALNTALYTALVLIFLLIVVTLFTASISNSGPYENNARLHMRYYNFALPLLLLAAASQLSLGGVASSMRSRLIVGLLLAAVVLYATYTHLAPYVPSFVDNPELRGFTFYSIVFYVLSGLSLLALIGWVYNARVGTKIFLYVLMPLSVVCSTFYVNQELRQRLVLDVFDKAGMFAKQYLSNAEISKVVIAGANPAGLFRTAFYLDNPSAAIEIIPEKSVLDVSKVVAGKEWILLIGEHGLSKNLPSQSRHLYELKMNGFMLIHVGELSMKENTNQENTDQNGKK